MIVYRSTEVRPESSSAHTANPSLSRNPAARKPNSQALLPCEGSLEPTKGRKLLHSNQVS